MNWKRLVSVALAFMAGVVVASFVHLDVKKSPPVSNYAGASNSMEAAVEVAALRKGFEKRLAELESQLTELRSQNESLRPGATRAAENPPQSTLAEDVHRIVTERLQKTREAKEERKVAGLVAAGFSADRIAWIEKRSAELELEYRQREDQLRQQGKMDMNSGLAHFSDHDIDLRREIGDDEYARYREALGRGTGMKIGEVVPGGIGEVAGLRPGDEVVAYNGVRIFNLGELNPLMSQFATSGTSLTVDVLRDGKRIRVNVAGGDLRVKSVLPPR